MDILRQFNLINEKKKYKITVNKRVPVFAGLGGGTSNSAFIIKYFLKNRVNNRLLSIFEKKNWDRFKVIFF